MWPSNNLYKCLNEEIETKGKSRQNIEQNRNKYKYIIAITWQEIDKKKRNEKIQNIGANVNSELRNR